MISEFEVELEHAGVCDNYDYDSTADKLSEIFDVRVSDRQAELMESYIEEQVNERVRTAQRHAVAAALSIIQHAKNPVLQIDLLWLAAAPTALAQTAQADVGRKHGVSRQYISKSLLDLCTALDIEPAIGRGEEHRETCLEREQNKIRKIKERLKNLK
jgi:hypothetical protein